ncbi:MAG: Na(+)-translocating NADH-quinone reductase subunit C [Proteobacteria bacterium]|nr:Na(+)-translocating NADH-quinone reductase subunit C [Pseudomonadota bacterium]MDA1300824.1 Na(+)-translocating NADH-quinone reductase subunit C [Pseudomonadota bacterium]
MASNSNNNKDSIKNIVIVTLAVCFVCSVIVSSAAVLLKPAREANVILDRNKNILAAAGLFEPGVTPEGSVQELFQSFEVRVVDLKNQRLMTEEEARQAGIDVAEYDQRKASKDSTMSVALSSSEDIASISRRANYALVYLLRREGELDRIVLPVHGYGLWSTLYGFIALEADLNTVAGITFYEHKETPGLGGEVDNPRWKSLWDGKQIYGPNGELRMRVDKTQVDPQSEMAKYHVDGLSGATLTTRGVSNLVSYWLGPDAFGPVLKRLDG